MTRHYWLILAVLIFSAMPTIAQTFQFLPEVDTYFGVNSHVRVYFQAKETREGGDPTQAEKVVHVRGAAKSARGSPLLRLKPAREDALL